MPSKTELILGDNILDPNVGSGASALAAIDLGFDYKGLDINPVYLSAAQERVDLHQKEHQHQTEMFTKKETYPELFTD